MQGGPSKLRRILGTWRLRFRRSRVAFRYLRGNGIEIGALHEPTALSPFARVRYVDRLKKDELCRRFPGLPVERIVETDIVTDGFVLDGIADSSQDFLIANHVLEHAPDALGALLTWLRTVRPGGHLLITVPIADRCFDKGRPVTDPRHFQEDHGLVRSGQLEAFWERNRAHYAEWVNVSLPAILREEPDCNGPFVPSDEEVEGRLAKREDIHFHTFSVESFRRFLELVPLLETSVEVVEVREAGAEVLGVIRR